MSLAAIQAIEPEAKAAQIYGLCVSAQKSVPERKDIRIIRVCLCADPGIDRILDGWNKQGIADEQVLRKGMEMIKGLYNGIR